MPVGGRRETAAVPRGGRAWAGGRRAVPRPPGHRVRHRLLPPGAGADWVAPYARHQRSPRTLRQGGPGGAARGGAIRPPRNSSTPVPSTSEALGTGVLRAARSCIVLVVAGTGDGEGGAVVDLCQLAGGAEDQGGDRAQVPRADAGCVGGAGEQRDPDEAG